MHSTTARGVTISRLAIAAIVLLTLYFFRDSWWPAYQEAPPKLHPPPIPHTESEEHIHHDDVPQQPPPNTNHQLCAEAPGADNVMVMLKTGATELYQKLPTHFVTTFKCIPHFMIFSDLAQDFADYPVHDAIEPVSKHFRDHHPDFELYRKLAQWKREGQDMSKLQGHGSWNLDKWKFLPMMHKAFTSAGDNIDWFIIIEADTSLSWTNLLQWLHTMDPKKPYYLGAQNVIGSTTFAHGGSGVVISRKAADDFEKAREEQGRQHFDEKWEELTSTSCCGDEVIARALLEAKVSLTPSWPIIQGETVASLDWTPNHWCTPPVSWHHVTPIEIDALWQFEGSWVDAHGWDAPYLFRDIFAQFIERHVGVNRTKWNNLSKDRKFASPAVAYGNDEDFDGLQDYEKKATESEEACAEACLRKPDEECIQWMYSPGRCYLGKDMRFGKSDERETEHWTSGWVRERMEKFRDRFRDCKVRWAG